MTLSKTTTLKSLLIASIMGVAFSTAASAADKGVIVIARDGSQHEVVFDNLKHIEIGSTAVTVHHVDGTTHTREIGDIDRLMIGAATSGINDIVDNGNIAVWPTTVTESVNIAGATAGATVTVADINGRTFTSELDSDGRATINVASMPAGILIVNVDNHTVKIIKK